MRFSFCFKASPAPENGQGSSPVALTMAQAPLQGRCPTGDVPGSPAHPVSSSLLSSVIFSSVAQTVPNPLQTFTSHLSSLNSLCRRALLKPGGNSEFITAPYAPSHMLCWFPGVRPLVVCIGPMEHLGLFLSSPDYYL